MMHEQKIIIGWHEGTCPEDPVHLHVKRQPRAGNVNACGDIHNRWSHGNNKKIQHTCMLIGGPLEALEVPVLIRCSVAITSKSGSSCSTCCCTVSISPLPCRQAWMCKEHLSWICRSDGFEKIAINCCNLSSVHSVTISSPSCKLIISCRKIVS